MKTHSSVINRLTAAARYLDTIRKLAISHGLDSDWIDVRADAESAMHEVEMSIKECAERGL